MLLLLLLLWQCHQGAAASDALRNFDEWAQEFAINPNEVVGNGVELAKARSSAFLNLIKERPLEALSRATSPSLLRSLPSAVTDHMERWEAGVGRASILCHMGNDSSIETASIKLNGGVYLGGPLHHVEARALGHPIAMHGVVLDGWIAVAASPLRTLSREDVEHYRKEHGIATPGKCSVSGDSASFSYGADVGGEIMFFKDNASLRLHEQRILSRESLSVRASYPTTGPVSFVVYLTKFSDEASYPTSPEAFDGMMHRSAEYWERSSHGRVSFELPFTYLEVALDVPRATFGACPISGAPDDSDLAEAVKVVARDATLAPARFDRYIIVLSYFDCPWNGLAAIGERAVVLRGPDPSSKSWYTAVDWRFIAHEIGHTYGLRHSELWVSADPDDPISEEGDVLQYGDDFDIMGGIFRPDWDQEHMIINTEKKLGMGWIDGVHTCTSSAHYRLYGHDGGVTDPGASYAVKIPRGSEEYAFWVEYKQAVDLPSAADYFVNGVTLHWGSEGIAVMHPSLLLDVNDPRVDTVDVYDGCKGMCDNSPLRVGTSISDREHNITISAVRKGEDETGPYIDVYVHIGDAPSSPLAPPEVYASCTSPELNEPVLFSAQFSSSSRLLTHWDFGENDGGSATGDRTVLHSFTSTGRKAVVVTLSDMMGRTATASMDVTVGTGSGCTRACTDDCSGHGTCAYSQCLCSEGYTGDACQTRLEVAAISPDFGLFGDAAAKITVTGQGFAVPPLRCIFDRIGSSIATPISATSAVCAVPPVQSDGRSASHVRVWVTHDESNVASGDSTYTFTTLPDDLSCTSPCGNGNCDVYVGGCACRAGYTGANCSQVFSINATLSPMVGPAWGTSSPVLLSVSGFGEATAPQCRFGTVITPGEVEEGVLSCHAPPAGGLDSVLVAASPDGLVFTPTAFQYKYKTSEDFIVGNTQLISVARGDYKFYRIVLPHAGYSVTASMARRSATGNMHMFLMAGRVATAQDDEGASVLTSPSSTTLSAPLSASVVYMTLYGEDTTEFAVTVEADGVAWLRDGQVSPLVAVSPESPTSMRTMVEDAHLTTIIEASVRSGSPASLVATSESGVQLHGSPLVFGPCDDRGLFTVEAFGEGVYSFQQRKESFPTPHAPTLTTVKRETRSITLSFLPAQPEAVDFTYAVIYKAVEDPAPADSVDKTEVYTFTLNNVCQLEGASELPRVAHAEVMNVVIEELELETFYEINVIVRSELGVPAVYRAALVRTLPNPIYGPLILSFGLFFAAVAIVLGVVFALIQKGRALRARHDEESKPPPKTKYKHRHRQQRIEGDTARPLPPSTEKKRH